MVGFAGKPNSFGSSPDGTNAIATSLDVTTSSEEQLLTAPVIEKHNLPYNNLQAYRTYPDDVKVVKASSGTVEKTGIVIQQLERSELVTFNNSKEATLTYPIDGGSLTTDTSNTFDADGNTVTGISVKEDPEMQNSPLYSGGKTRKVVANKSFTGVVRVTYTTSYSLWTYKPDVTLQGGFFAKAVSIQYGNITAFYNGQMASIEVQPPGVGESRKKEIYRVYSVVITNEHGAWERPQGWSGGADWSNEYSPSSEVPTVDDSVREEERVHEIGYVFPSTIGDPLVESFFVGKEKPKANTTGYDTPVDIRWSNESEFIGTIHESSYNAVISNKQDLENKIFAQRFADHEKIA